MELCVKKIKDTEFTSNMSEARWQHHMESKESLLRNSYFTQSCLHFQYFQIKLLYCFTGYSLDSKFNVKQGLNILGGKEQR
jgi:hypothetical protein